MTKIKKIEYSEFLAGLKEGETVTVGVTDRYRREFPQREQKATNIKVCITKIGKRIEAQASVQHGMHLGRLCGHVYSFSRETGEDTKGYARILGGVYVNKPHWEPAT